MTRVISLCDFTGAAVRPWAEAGYECVCYDLQHPLRSPRVEGRITFQHADVRALTPEDFGGVPAFVFAFPPCTHLAVSGARDFKRKGLRRLIEALEIVEACRILCEWTGCPSLLENPVGTLSTYWRVPDFTFNPCDYGGYPGGESDGYTKRTCLWTSGGFVMPEPRPIAPSLGSMMHRMPPSAERANQRSATPAGFAQAVFEANAPRLLVEGAA